MKHIKFLPLLLLFCSCNFRIYTNEKFDHKEKGLTSKWRTTNDSCILLISGDKQPIGAVAINKTEIQSPLVWLTGHSPNEIMSNLLKTQAQKVGANVVRIDSIYSKKSTRLHVKASMYALTGDNLSNYKKQVNTSLEADKNYCIIYLKNLAFLYVDSINLLFNDSLLLALPKADRRHLHTWPTLNDISNTKTITFRIDHDGMFVAQYISKGKEDKSYLSAKINLKKGTEYYFYLNNAFTTGDLISGSGSSALQFVKYDKPNELRAF